MHCFQKCPLDVIKPFDDPLFMTCFPTLETPTQNPREVKPIQKLLRENWQVVNWVKMMQLLLNKLIKGIKSFEGWQIRVRVKILWWSDDLSWPVHIQQLKIISMHNPLSLINLARVHHSSSIKLWDGTIALHWDWEQKSSTWQGLQNLLSSLLLNDRLCTFVLCCLMFQWIRWSKNEKFWVSRWRFNFQVLLDFFWQVPVV